MHATRRRFLAAAAAATLPAGLPWPAQGKDADDPFVVTLAAAPRPDPATPGALSFDGSAAGPVLRVPKGRALAVTLRNGLGTPLALQWHGLRGPVGIDAGAGPDGGPLPPGGMLEQRFTPPDSGLSWFHAASLPGLPDQTAAGLRGVLIVEEPEPPAVDRDILLALGDGAAGAILVGGSTVPMRERIVPGGRCRLRIVSQSTARILVLAVEGAHPKVVAIDGQPSGLFAPARDAVPVGPGARFDLMLDAPREAGATVRLLTRTPGLGDRPAGDAATLLELVTDGPPAAMRPAIAALPPNPSLPEAIALERAVRADLAIEAVTAPAQGAAFRLNGAASLRLPANPLVAVPRGGVVTLGLQNRTDVAVPIRIHGHAVRLLHARDDGWEPYWRDSVILPPRGVTHIAFAADNPGAWLIESALHAQAAFGLRHWFRVG